MNNKEIIKIAAERLSVVITDMRVRPCTMSRISNAAVAHDLVKIIKLASGIDSDVKEEEDESM